MSKAPPPTKTSVQIAANPLINTVFSDAALVKKQADGMVWIYFCNQNANGIPNVWSEEARIVLTAEHAKKVMAALAKELADRPESADAPLE